MAEALEKTLSITLTSMTAITGVAAILYLAIKIMVRGGNTDR